MSGWTEKPGRRLIAMALAIIVVVVVGNAYHLSVKPVALPTLLFELLEVALVVGSSIAWVPLARRVR